MTAFDPQLIAAANAIVARSESALRKGALAMCQMQTVTVPRTLDQAAAVVGMPTADAASRFPDNVIASEVMTEQDLLALEVGPPFSAREWIPGNEMFSMGIGLAQRAIRLLDEAKALIVGCEIRESRPHFRLARQAPLSILSRGQQLESMVTGACGLPEAVIRLDFAGCTLEWRDEVRS